MGYAHLHDCCIINELHVDIANPSDVVNDTNPYDDMMASFCDENVSFIPIDDSQDEFLTITPNEEANFAMKRCSINRRITLSLPCKCLIILLFLGASSIYFFPFGLFAAYPIYTSCSWSGNIITFC